MLNWRTLPLKYRDDAFVKGTELDVCYPDGFRHRFAIYSVRCLGWGTDSYGKPVTEYDVFYRVRDAEAASASSSVANAPRFSASSPRWMKH